MVYMKPFLFKDNKGHKYEVIFKRLPSNCSYMGLCEDPEEDAPQIVIKKNLGDKSLLNTIIHEFAHAFFWESTEGNVRTFANKVTKLLYEMGWRYEKIKIKKAKKTRKRNTK